MGPIELTFFIIILLFGAVGIVRGYHRELGVIVMLLLTLFMLLFVDTVFEGTVASFLSFVAGPDASDQAIAKGLIFSVLLILVVFISYQGETLIFPGTNRYPLLGLGAGLLNGYLFAGSIWYYLAEAGWPYLQFEGPFSSAYQATYRLLPPTILDWRYLVVLVTILLILRVWK